MTSEQLDELKAILEKEHSGDYEQLDVIFTPDTRLVVEAPAGYGKTRTMISKLAYVIASSSIPTAKKIVALTFSVNAAYKIKRDVLKQLPVLLQIKSNYEKHLGERITVSNYHGYSRRILSKYGYLLHENLKNLGELKTLDDSDPKVFTRDVGTTLNVANFLVDFGQAIKEANTDVFKEDAEAYTKIVIRDLLPRGYITYNAIILLACHLLQLFPEVKTFYRLMNSVVIVDEFQDTNLLSWQLLQELVGDKTHIILMGDPLQRIYGFIGAMPNLMPEAQQIYGLRPIVLKNNYRFKDNPSMLLLDKNIRAIAENPKSPDIRENAVINFHLFRNQEEEANAIISLYRWYIARFPECSVAVLVKSRGPNVNKIMEAMTSSNVDFFYGLFSDEDKEYIAFHARCLAELTQHKENHPKANKSSLATFEKTVNNIFKTEVSATISSLLELLKALVERLSTEFSYLSDDEKYEMLYDVFYNRVLKQQMEYLKKNLVVSTIHGAKGLEWDIVILPDMEQMVFPGYYAMCGACKSKSDCSLNVMGDEQKFLNELSVFYVGVTRAKKDVIFTASRMRLGNRGPEPCNVSCFMRLPGVQYRSGAS